MLRPLLLALACAGWSAAAGAAVNVAFVAPERYADATAYDSRLPQAREPVLKDLRRHLERLGERQLAPAQTLTLEVLDVDLAGRFEAWRPQARDVRFLREATWPRIVLRWRLDEAGREVAAGEETVTDLNYLGRPTRYGSHDRLRYEKAMLDGWFQRRIVERRPAPAE